MTTLLAADMLTRTSTGEAVMFWVLGRSHWSARWAW